jgi:hypothetical protein
MMNMDNQRADDIGATPIFASLCEQFDNRDDNGTSAGVEGVPVGKEPLRDCVDATTNLVGR